MNLNKNRGSICAAGGAGPSGTMSFVTDQWGHG